MTCAQSNENKIENRSFVTFSRTSVASARAANGLASRNYTHGNPAFLPGAHAPPVLVFVRFFLAILRMGTAPFSLLRILADGRFHSGERLGRVLGLSRAGIWNLIRRVEALGLRVFKVRGRGYRLAEALDLFESPALAARCKKIAPELCVEVLDQCPSTNTVLAQRAAAGAPHGTVLVCEHQSAGRGRRGNSWISEVGGSLAFSILWRFPRGAGALGGLSLAVAVGAAKALERLGTEGVEVKWPNDLYCAGRKLGGILIESSGDILGPSTVIVGVGINVRLGARTRKRIGGPATDIASHSEAAPSRTAVFVESLESIAGVLARFSREGFVPFRREWLQRHAWQGRRVALLQGGRRVAEGKVVGVAEDGALMLASVEGIRRFHSGELSLRPG
jgi:BirA family biotin operon repressor/biotin-[acetyl-CoA-carboxylase] ligase